MSLPVPARTHKHILSYRNINDHTEVDRNMHKRSHYLNSEVDVIVND